ncbi:hypothetical protein MPSEU_001043900 [Mayamaea pseudoterrestris]|nr:hypothetical protein MPSEU_001043900 [Mayamaea pseudoterrestris]
MSGSYDQYFVSFRNGLVVAIATVLVTVLLEAISCRTVGDLLTKHPRGRTLYTKAVTLNLVNHILFGVPIYVLSESLFCKNRDFVDWTYAELSWSMLRIFAIVLFHSIGYYFVHKAMHTVPGLYKFHAFHHRFKDFIPPSAANAVSPAEYVVAYILPFAVGAGIARPSIFELQSAVCIVSLFNLLVHMPAMEAFSSYFEPHCVSASSHKRHHTSLTCNYAAPTMNLDMISNEMARFARGARNMFATSTMTKTD